MLVLAATTLAIAVAKILAQRHGVAIGERAALHDGSGLPPVSRAQVRAVMRDAEKAAIRQVREGQATPNPHKPGTREHIIWAAHHGATLLDEEG